MGASYEEEEEVGESSKSVVKLKTIVDDSELESGQVKVKKKDEDKKDQKKLDSEEKSKEKVDKAKKKDDDGGGDGDLSFKMAVTPSPHNKNNATQNRMKKGFFARGLEGTPKQD